MMDTKIKKAAIKLLAKKMPSRCRERRVVVLCYHSVHPSKPFASVTPEQFEMHLRWMREHCEIIPFSRILKTIKEGGREHPTVAITFDDGYADNYEYAFPALQKYGACATFFVTIGLIEKDPDVVERFQKLRSASYAEIQPLTWEQIREMLHAGMEFGNHTWSHRNLARLSPETARWELCRSKEIMEERLGRAVRLLAYPFGKPRRHFTRVTMDLASQAGFDLAAAVIFRGVQDSDHPLSIPRFFVTRDNLDLLQAKIEGRLDILGWWQEHAPALLTHIMSPRRGVNYELQ